MFSNAQYLSEEGKGEGVEEKGIHFLLGRGTNSTIFEEKP